MKILYAGRFGEAVASRLASTRGADIAPLTSVEAATEVIESAGEELLVFALARPFPALMRRLDTSLEGCGTTWTAAVLRNQLLMCGPVHKPGAGPCWDCTIRRYLTLTSSPYSPEVERAFDAACDRSSDDLLIGFLPPLVHVAAAAIAYQADALETLSPGHMTLFDTLESGVMSTRIVPLHGCRCRGSSTSRGPDRFVNHLPDLAPETIP